MKAKQFQSLLHDWFIANPRELPWLEEKNPYYIWISEIILQQTRTAQAIPYYKKFITRFPNIPSLATATLDEVMQYWQGLGYYSRAKNLWESAVYICQELEGKFPTSYNEIIKLKGVGKYTAAAISSFAFNEKKVVIDGNVIRIICRLFGIESEISNVTTQKLIEQKLHTLFENANSAIFNQAIMNFGALCCIPKNPNCITCPFKNYCQAYQKNLVNLIPVKKQKAANKNRYFHYLVFQLGNNSTLIHQRKEKDIWQNLYEFPLIETKSSRQVSVKQVQNLLQTICHNKAISVEKIFSGKQILSHQNINSAFYLIDLKGFKAKKGSEFFLVKQENLSNFAFPKTILVFLEQILIPKN